MGELLLSIALGLSASLTFIFWAYWYERRVDMTGRRLLIMFVLQFVITMSIAIGIANTPHG